jgi:TPP-dependent pyruvate/acetoin dehydrogenase alpha subunit
MALSKSDLIKMCRQMVYVRKFEEHIEEEFKAGNIPGWCHLGIGQEAVQVGSQWALRKDDYYFYDHRNKVMTLISGTDPKAVMAECFGKATGICKGRGGEMHIADKDVGNMGNNEIQGANLAISLGTAVAAQIKGTDQVTAVFFGDGTTGRGEFHEGLNLAAVWNLPIVYSCANNLYAISTPHKEVHAVEHIADWAKGYGIPAEIVDGNDVLAVYEATKKAVDHARSGKGPYFLECKTYRWQGHFVGDPAANRPEEEVAYWKDRCPIERMKEHLIDKGHLTENEFVQMSEEVEEEIHELVKYALESPEPPVEDSVKYVYSGLEVAAR